MRITQKLVAEVKKSNQQKWHDQKWHDFQSLPEVEAIGYALSQKSADDTPKDIVAAAKRYLEVTSK